MGRLTWTRPSPLLPAAGWAAPDVGQGCPSSGSLSGSPRAVSRSQGSPCKGPGPASWEPHAGPDEGPGPHAGPPRVVLQTLGWPQPPNPQSQGHPTDLVALTQHMALFLPGDGLRAGVPGPRKAMWLRGHAAEIQPASPRRVRPDASALPKVLSGWLHPMIPPPDSRPLHLGPVASRASSPPRTSCCRVPGQPRVASTSCLPPSRA